MSEPEEKNFHIKIKNPAHRKVIMDVAKIKLLDGEYELSLQASDIVRTGFRYPFPLEGDWMGIADHRIIKEQLAKDLSKNKYSGNVKFKVEVTDSSGKIHSAKNLLEFNVDEWLKSDPQGGY